MPELSELTELTAGIVAAFVSNNPLRAAELPELIAAVHASVVRIVTPKPVEPSPAVLTPAVSIKKSITGDYLICLDDGKKFKSLKRHLATIGMTPHEYRTKWGLPRDYPMVAPGYAAQRSVLAKAAGLGNRRKTVLSTVEAPSPDAVMTPVSKGSLKRGKPADPEDGASAAPAKRRGRPRKIKAAA